MAGLSLSLLLIIGLLVVRAAHDEPYVAPPAGPQAQAEAAPALAAAALHDLEVAVRDRDEGAAEALAPEGDAQARELLVAIVANADAARVQDFSLRYVDELGTVDAEGSWSAAVDATWAFRAFDAAPARSEVRITFLRADERVLISGVGGGDRRTPVWLAGPLEVRRTARTLVLVSGIPRQADRYAREARAAVPAVLAVLPRWRGRLVVEVPSSSQAMHRALDSDPGTFDSIAAVTTTVDGSLAPDAPVHVFINPQVFGGLKPRGAQVVMSHETVHVATDAATSAVPLWLLEGFADYVALRDVPLSLATTASQIIRRVRKNGPPQELPGPDDFDTGASHLGAAYEAAWLACRVLADLGSERDLVRVYDRVNRGEPVSPALEAEFGIDEPDLTARWRGYLTEIAR